MLEAPKPPSKEERARALTPAVTPPPQSAPILRSHEPILEVLKQDLKNEKVIGALILAVVIIFVIAWGLYKLGKKNSQTAPQQTAEDIRKIFTPPATSTPPVVGMIDPGGAFVSKQTRGPKTPEPPQVLGANTPPPPAFQVYQNPELGFKINLTQDWQATQAGDGQTVAFVSNNGQNVSVQSFQNPGADLSTIEQQLAGSPSVSSISKINFLGEPALQFKTQTGAGLAVIHNNRLFYIMASSLSGPPINSFSFL